MDPAPPPVKLDATVDEGIKRVVLTLANPPSRVKLCSNLADEDATGGDLLAPKTLDSETLGV